MNVIIMKLKNMKKETFQNFKKIIKNELYAFISFKSNLFGFLDTGIIAVVYIKQNKSFIKYYKSIYKNTQI